MQKGNIDLAVIYEDAHVLFVNKPAGLLSQKAKPSDVSLVEVITEYLIYGSSVRASATGWTEIPPVLLPPGKALWDCRR